MGTWQQGKPSAYIRCEMESTANNGEAMDYLLIPTCTITPVNLSTTGAGGGGGGENSGVETS